jgi:hypothetical protein
MHYVGMDGHITTLEFAVVNEAGRLVKADRVATGVNQASHNTGQRITGLQGNGVFPRQLLPVQRAI